MTHEYYPKTSSRSAVMQEAGMHHQDRLRHPALVKWYRVLWTSGGQSHAFEDAGLCSVCFKQQRALGWTALGRGWTALFMRWQWPCLLWLLAFFLVRGDFREEVKAQPIAATTNGCGTSGNKNFNYFYLKELFLYDLSTTFLKHSQMSRRIKGLVRKKEMMWRQNFENLFLVFFALFVKLVEALGKMV